jgi:hypothetical protein
VPIWQAIARRDHNVCPVVGDARRISGRSPGQPPDKACSSATLLEALPAQVEEPGPHHKQLILIKYFPIQGHGDYPRVKDFSIKILHNF